MLREFVLGLARQMRAWVPPLMAASLPPAVLVSATVAIPFGTHAVRRAETERAIALLALRAATGGGGS
jgi:hypothetical protein